MFALDVGCSEKTKPIALGIEAYYIGHRSLLHWASKPVAMGIEAGCIFGTVKHPASTHLTEEPINPSFLPHSRFICLICHRNEADKFVFGQKIEKIIVILHPIIQTQ